MKRDKVIQTVKEFPQEFDLDSAVRKAAAVISAKAAVRLTENELTEKS